MCERITECNHLRRSFVSGEERTPSIMQEAQLQPGMIQVSATSKLEKDVAYALSQLHEAARPTVANAQCNLL